MLRVLAVAALPILSLAQELSIEDLTDDEIVAMELNCGKAGMEGLDRERVNAVIEEASRGSRASAGGNSARRPDGP